MRRQGLQSTKEKYPDTDLEDKIKTNIVYCTTVGPITTKEGKIYSNLCGRFPTTSSRGDKYIYVMYVYDCNSILTTATKNKINKEMIRAFTPLTEYLRIRGIHPGFHFMENESSTALNMTMTTMNIKCQLVPPSNHIANNAEISIQTFKNHFIEVLCIVDNDFHLQLWDRLLQQANISLNLLRKSGTLPHISAYTHILGEFDFNLTPLSPPDKIVVMHNRLNYRALWASHGEYVLYIVP